MKHITQDQFVKMPWKNGGGVTTEIYRLSKVTPERFHFRLSLAKVEQDGPFSLYPEMNRHILILDGEGCRLNFSKRSVLLTTQSPPFFFSGDEVIECSLESGPVNDFNVMINRNWGDAEVKTGICGNETLKCSSDYLFFYDLKRKELFELKIGDELAVSETPFITIIVTKK